jgi:hypothetical protein
MSQVIKHFEAWDNWFQPNFGPKKEILKIFFILSHHLPVMVAEELVEKLQ